MARSGADGIASYRHGGGMGCASAGAGAAGWLGGYGGGKKRAAGGWVRRTARRVVDQGLLSRPGTDGADEVSRSGEAAAGARCHRWSDSPAGHTGAARRGGGWRDAFGARRHGAGPVAPGGAWRNRTALR